MNALTIVAVGIGLIGVILGAFAHSIVVARKMSMLGDWQADLELRELHLSLAPPATPPARAVGTSTVKPRDADPNAPVVSVPPADQPTRRARAYRFAADAYPTIANAARALSDPLPTVSVPGRPQDTRELADALAGNPRPHVGRHAAEPDDWT